MTITRELQSATVKTYGTAVDAYGQLVQNSDTRTIDVTLKVYTQQNTADPRYVDVDMIGLTKDTQVAPGEVLSLTQGDYRVKYVLPTGRWYQLMLKKL